MESHSSEDYRSDNEASYRIKKVVLANGKTIEILYFDTAKKEDTKPVNLSASTPEAVMDIEVEFHDSLEYCAECDSDLVYPIAWREGTKEENDWIVERRCPNCEWRSEGQHTQDEVEIYDDILNDGTEELRDLLAEESEINMREDVERLISALGSNAIMPMDFNTPRVAWVDKLPHRSDYFPK